MNIPEQRLRNQHIARPRRGPAADLVAHPAAVQAQEYPFAKWAIALRLGRATTHYTGYQSLMSGKLTMGQ